MKKYMVISVAYQFHYQESVKYSSQFNWETHIIKDDKTLNAFCTPGGKIYAIYRID